MNGKQAVRLIEESRAFPEYTLREIGRGDHEIYLVWQYKDNDEAVLIVHNVCMSDAFYRPPEPVPYYSFSEQEHESGECYHFADFVEKHQQFFAARVKEPEPAPDYSKDEAWESRREISRRQFGKEVGEVM